MTKWLSGCMSKAAAADHGFSLLLSVPEGRALLCLWNRQGMEAMSQGSVLHFFHLWRHVFIFIALCVEMDPVMATGGSGLARGTGPNIFKLRNPLAGEWTLLFLRPIQSLLLKASSNYSMKEKGRGKWKCILLAKGDWWHLKLYLQIHNILLKMPVLGAKLYFPSPWPVLIERCKVMAGRNLRNQTNPSFTKETKIQRGETQGHWAN